jgi:DHA2 family multidrug resistance protein
VATAQAVGIPLNLFALRGPGPLDPATKAMLQPMVERLAFARASNEAWAMLAILTAAAVVSVTLAPPQRTRPDGARASSG